VPFPGKLIVIFWKHVFAYSAVISGKIKHIFWNLFFVVVRFRFDTSAAMMPRWRFCEFGGVIPAHGTKFA
jgi:hypothetical protein